MSKLLARFLYSIAISILFVAASVGVTQAASSDYRFELASQPMKSGKATLVKVRLVQVANGKPVAGAVIFQTRFDMGPDGMAEMTAPVKAASPAEPGVYQFEAQPSMAGNWALTLSAKVQGEMETVKGTVTVAVPK
jgi:hypothetical protein